MAAANPWEPGFSIPASASAPATLNPWDSGFVPEAPRGNALIGAGPAPDSRGEFSKGVASGLDTLAADGAGFLALLGASVGHDGVRDWGLNKYQEITEQSARANAPKVASYRDIDSASDFLDYSANLVGQTLPFSISTVFGGGLGGIITKAIAPKLIARGIGEALVKKSVEKILADKTKKVVLAEAMKQARAQATKTLATRGALAGSMVAGAPIQQGELFQHLTSVGVEDTPAALASWGLGFVQASLDVAPEAFLAHLVLNPKRVEKELAKSIARGVAGKPEPSRLARFGKNVGAGTLLEGATEGSQEAIKYVAEALTNPDFKWDTEEKEAVAENAVAGALIGLLLGTGGASLHELLARSEEEKKNAKPKTASTTSSAGGVVPPANTSPPATGGGGAQVVPPAAGQTQSPSGGQAEPVLSGADGSLVVGGAASAVGSPTELAEIGGAAKAIGENLRSQLWAAYQSGATTMSGVRDPILAAAKNAGVPVDEAAFYAFMEQYGKGETAPPLVTTPPGATTAAPADTSGGDPNAQHQRGSLLERGRQGASPAMLAAQEQAAAAAAASGQTGSLLDRAHGRATPSTNPTQVSSQSTVTDAPSAQPLSFYASEFKDARNPETPRRGVYVPVADVEQHKLQRLIAMAHGEKDEKNPLVGRPNADGKHGVLFASSADLKEFERRRSAGEDPNALIGEFTGASAASPTATKPQTATPTVVQRRDETGAPVQETVATPDTTQQVAETMSTQGPGEIVVTTPEAALAQREEAVAAEQAVAPAESAPPAITERPAQAEGPAWMQYRTPELMQAFLDTDPPFLGDLEQILDPDERAAAVREAGAFTKWINGKLGHTPSSYVRATWETWEMKKLDEQIRLDAADDVVFDAPSGVLDDKLVVQATTYSQDETAAIRTVANQIGGWLGFNSRGFLQALNFLTLNPATVEALVRMRDAGAEPAVLTEAVVRAALGPHVAQEYVRQGVVVDTEPMTEAPDVTDAEVELDVEGQLNRDPSQFNVIGQHKSFEAVRRARSKADKRAGKNEFSAATPWQTIGPAKELALELANADPEAAYTVLPALPKYLAMYGIDMPAGGPGFYVLARPKLSAEARYSKLYGRTLTPVQAAVVAMREGRRRWSEVFSEEMKEDPDYVYGVDIEVSGKMRTHAIRDIVDLGFFISPTLRDMVSEDRGLAYLYAFYTGLNTVSQVGRVRGIEKLNARMVLSHPKGSSPLTLAKVLADSMYTREEIRAAYDAAVDAYRRRHPKATHEQLAKAGERGKSAFFKANAKQRYALAVAQAQRLIDAGVATTGAGRRRARQADGLQREAREEALSGRDLRMETIEEIGGDSVDNTEGQTIGDQIRNGSIDTIDAMAQRAGDPERTAPSGQRERMIPSDQRQLNPVEEKMGGVTRGLGSTLGTVVAASDRVNNSKWRGITPLQVSNPAAMGGYQESLLRPAAEPGALQPGARVGFASVPSAEQEAEQTPAPAPAPTIPPESGPRSPTRARTSTYQLAERVSVTLRAGNRPVETVRKLVTDIHKILRLKRDIYVVDNTQDALAIAQERGGIDPQYLAHAASDRGQGGTFVPGPDYAIIFMPSVNDNISFLKSLAHEMGHAFFREHWNSANSTVHAVVTREFEHWLTTAAGKAMLKRRPNYNIEEYIADQVAAYINGDKKAASIAGRWYSELAARLKQVVDYLKNAGILPQAQAQAFIRNTIAPGSALEAAATAPVAAPAKPRVRRLKRIIRANLRNHRDEYFLFGDNLKGVGLGGQAKEMRGEPNAVGIPTKKSPSMDEGSFFTDAEYDANVAAIDAAFAKIPEGATVVIPEDGLGTGLAQLDKRAPRTFAYLQSKIAALEASETPVAKAKHEVPPLSDPYDYSEMSLGQLSALITRLANDYKRDREAYVAGFLDPDSQWYGDPEGPTYPANELEALRRELESRKAKTAAPAAKPAQRWARHDKNGYELSSHGDKRFSALFARLKDGRTIEEAYQLDVKGYRQKGNDWRLGKGKPPLDKSVNLWDAYLGLWRQWAQENPQLIEDLRAKAEGKVLTDKFASTPISQARALATILDEAAVAPVAAPAAAPSATSAGAAKKVSMFYRMPAEAVRAGLRARYPAGTSTMQLIKDGVRTATTRSYPLGKVGELIKFDESGALYRITGVEKLGALDWERWSQLEGWDPAYVRKHLAGQVKPGAWQTTFESVTNAEQAADDEVAPGTNPFPWTKRQPGDVLHEIETQDICIATANTVRDQIRQRGRAAAKVSLKAKSPLGDFEIGHYAALTEIDGERVLIDMPQTEMISPGAMVGWVEIESFTGRGNGLSFAVPKESSLWTLAELERATEYVFGGLTLENLTAESPPAIDPNSDAEPEFDYDAADTTRYPTFEEEKAWEERYEADLRHLRTANKSVVTERVPLGDGWFEGPLRGAEYAKLRWQEVASGKQTDLGEVMIHNPRATTAVVRNPTFTPRVIAITPKSLRDAYGMTLRDAISHAKYFQSARLEPPLPANPVHPSFEALGPLDDALSDMNVAPSDPAPGTPAARYRDWWRALRLRYPTAAKYLDASHEAMMWMHERFTARLFMRVERLGIPAFDEIMRRFYARVNKNLTDSELGAADYDKDVRGHLNKFIGTYRTIIARFQGPARHQVLRLLRGLSVPEASEEMLSAVGAIQNLLAEAYQYGEASGLALRELANYFPVVYDQKAFREPGAAEEIQAKALADGVVNPVTHQPYTVEEIQDIFAALIDEGDTVNAMLPDLDEDINIRAPFMASARKRVVNDALRNSITGIADENGHPKYLSRDLDWIMRSYFAQLVHRAEYNKRLGDMTYRVRHNAWIEGGREGEEAKFDMHLKLKESIQVARSQGAGPEEIGLMLDALSAMTGQYGRISSPEARKLMNGMQLFQNLRTLLFVVLSSFPDLANHFIMTGEFKDTFRVMHQNARAALKGELNDVLSMFGYANDAADATFMENLSSLRDADGLAHKLNATFFQAIGLHKWTQFTRALALKQSLHYIEKHNRLAWNEDGSIANRDSADRLAELGLRHGDVDAWIATNPDAAEGRATKFTGDTSPEVARVTAAVQHMTDSIVIHPAPAEKTLWGNSEAMKLLWHLKSFMYGFSTRVLGRSFGKIAEAGFSPQAAVQLAALSLLLPLAAFGLALRDLLQYWLWGEETHTPYDDPIKYLGVLAGRSGITGFAQYGADIAMASEKGRAPLLAVAGPTVTFVNDWLEYPLSKSLPGSIPLIASIPGIRNEIGGWMKDTFYEPAAQ